MDGCYINFGATYPLDTPLTYTFTMVDSANNTTIQTDDIDVFIEPFATNLSLRHSFH